MFDCHMHTRFSADSKMTIQEVKEQIKKKGIGVILTEHMDLDFPGDMPFEFEPEAYFDTYGKERSDALLLGVEVGLQLGVIEKNRNIIENYDFDFVLGSVHTVGGMDLCADETYYQGKTKEEAYRLYFQTMYENIKAFHDFDSLGHLDYISRYCPYQDPEITFELFKEEIELVLKEAIKHDIAIEINTRRLPLPGVTENYQKILQHYKILGGRYVTCGSDSHLKEAIGSSLKEAYALAEAVGLQPVYFKKRQRQHSEG